MDTKMFSEAENNSSLASDALHAWLSLLVKFPSPVLLAIVDGWSENWSHCKDHCYFLQEILVSWQLVIEHIHAVVLTVDKF